LPTPIKPDPLNLKNLNFQTEEDALEEYKSPVHFFEMSKMRKLADARREWMT